MREPQRHPSMTERMLGNTALARLTPPAHMLACRYLDARRRGGEALLDAAAILAEARERTKHGEWYPFLLAVNTSEDRAKRLLDIHRKATEDPDFADAVRRDWLSLSTAALLAQPSTPPTVVACALTAPAPPEVREVRTLLKGVRASTALPAPRAERRLGAEGCIGEMIAIFDSLGDVLQSIPDCINERDTTRLQATLERAQTLRAKGLAAARLLQEARTRRDSAA